MSTRKEKKERSIENLSTQERQALYNASPYFKKKNEDVAELLKKHPIPKEILNR